MTAPPPAIYARVSTGRQTESLETQLGRLRAAAPGAAEFSDVLSGRGVDRPGFERLLEQVRAGRVGALYVSRLDRLGRSAKGILDTFDVCDRHGVRVVVVDQAIDTSTPAGRLLRTVLAAMAELEADLISDRTREAMAAFKAGTRTTRSGRPVGRPRLLTPEIAERIARLRDVPDDGGRRRTWGQIARIVHHPAGTIKKWYSASRRQTPSVINPRGEFGASSADPQHP